MGLEVSTTINGLNSAWPLGTDKKGEGDDHLRLLKAVLKAVLDDADGTSPVRAQLLFKALGLTLTATPTLATDIALMGAVVSTITPRLLTASTTWTKPAGLKFLRLEGVGAGGGGGGAPVTAASNASAGAGGGSGGSIRALIRAADLPASVAVTIGAGGGSGGVGAAGNNGGTTTFGSLITLGGGGGGGVSQQTAPNMTTATGTGGTVSSTLPANSVFSFAGNPGAPGFMSPTTVVALGGHGGASSYGGAGRGAGNPSNGANATGFGSGGAGASRAGSADGGGAGGGGGTAALWLWEIF